MKRRKTINERTEFAQEVDPCPLQIGFHEGLSEGKVLVKKALAVDEERIYEALHWLNRGLHEFVHHGCHYHFCKIVPALPPNPTWVHHLLQKCGSVGALNESADASQLFLLGYLCYWGYLMIPRDEERAFRLFERAARHGSVYAVYWQGCCAMRGLGAPASRAHLYMERAALAGCADAALALAKGHFWGVTMEQVPQCYERAARHFLSAHQLGHAQARHLLALTRCQYPLSTAPWSRWTPQDHPLVCDPVHRASVTWMLVASRKRAFISRDVALLVVFFIVTENGWQYLEDDFIDDQEDLEDPLLCNFN